MNAFLHFSAGPLICLMMAQQPAILDFTVVSRTANAAPPDSASTGIIAGKPEQITGGITPGMTPPLISVVLKSVTPSACVEREQVVYDVELTNAGTAPFLLPWSTSREDTLTGGTLEHYRKLTVVLMTETVMRGSAVIEPVSEAFGSPLSPGTLRSLKPGERVWLRAPANCPTRPAATSHQANGADNVVQVFAEVGIWPKPNVHRGSLRTNTLDLKVLK
jgi:hypothetical protein